MSVRQEVEEEIREKKNQLKDSKNALNERCKKMQVNTRETYQFPYCDYIRKL